MNKTSLLIIILAIGVGVLLENQFDILPNYKGEEDQLVEINEAPKWSKEFNIVEIKSPVDDTLQLAYFYKTNRLHHNRSSLVSTPGVMIIRNTIPLMNMLLKKTTIISIQTSEE